MKGIIFFSMFLVLIAVTGCNSKDSVGNKAGPAATPTTPQKAETSQQSGWVFMNSVGGISRANLSLDGTFTISNVSVGGK